jgi:hypothetical protein
MKDSFSLPKLTAQMANKFAPLQLIILDEISMISQHFLAHISSFLQTLKGSTLAFGGISMVFCGDFCQLPPIEGTPVYKKPINTRFETPPEPVNESIPEAAPSNANAPPPIQSKKAAPKKPPNLSRAALNYEGYNLWQLINVSIFLMENNRFKNDPIFGQRISRLRLGQSTPEDLAAFNSRLVTGTVQIPPDKHIPYIVISNKLKHALNMKALVNHAIALNQPLDCFDAPISLPKKSKKILSPQLLKELHQLTPDLTASLPTHCQMFLGMWIMFTWNLDLATQISNGTFGSIVHISYQPNDDVSSLPINATINARYVFNDFCVNISFWGFNLFLL